MVDIDLGTRPWSLVEARVWAAWAAPAALYALAATLLTLHVGERPNFAHNWESYTAWQAFAFWDRPSTRIFGLTDGLMTNSGDSPLIAIPIWFGWRLGEVDLTAMRFPIALIAATAVPLLWLVGRRLSDTWIATLASLLLALLPVFLLYGRTATLVGISLVPALATIYVLARLVDEPRRTIWRIALQALLLTNSCAYAPIRFLWLLCLALPAIEVMVRPAEERRLTLVFVVTATVLPATLVAIGDG